MPNITRTLSPAGAITNGAAWCVKSSVANTPDWKASGESVTVVAGTYTVQYRYAEMYSSPADETVVIVASNDTATSTYGAIAWKAAWQPPISMCLFRGQVFTIGVKHTTPDTGVSDARLVRWSEIGAFRFLDCTANPVRNEAGEFYLGESDSEMGMRVLPMKNCVMAYGSFSAWALIPVVQPVPGFAFQKVLPTGIKQPLAVGGPPEKHLLIDRMGYLWLLTPDGVNVKATRIGHQELFYDMQDSLSIATGVGLISIVYNYDDDEFYISNGKKSFIFSDNVLTELSKAYTSYISVGEALLSSHEGSTFTGAPMSCVTSLDTNNVTVVSTEPFNFGIAGIKTISGVNIIGSFGDAYVSVDWRNNKSKPFMSTPWRRCSPQGFCAPMVSGVDLRINCMMPYSEAHIDSLAVEWQLSDKQSVRGNYVNKTST